MTPVISRRHFLAAMLATALPLYGCSQSSELENINGIDLSTVDFGSDFKLAGTDGAQHSLADFKGKVVLVFFGFTQCPDVCPTALYHAAEAKRMLGADGDRLQILFITVDPERDTPEVLKEYVNAFDSSFLGLYGDLEQTAQTARDFRVYYEKVPTGSSYTIDHSAMTYVYDANSKLRLGLRHTQSVEEYVDDIRQVLALS